MRGETDRVEGTDGVPIIDIKVNKPQIVAGLGTNQRRLHRSAEQRSALARHSQHISSDDDFLMVRREEHRPSIIHHLKIIC